MAKQVADSMAPAAGEEMVRQYMPRVYNLAFRMLGNTVDAEDVTQEVLLQVLRKGNSFRGEAAFPTWLYRVAVNAALAYREKRTAQRPRRSFQPLEQISEGPGAGPDQPVLDEETQRLIEALDVLPPMYRDVFVLADVEGLSNHEIRDLLALSLAAVKSRLHRPGS